MVLSLNGNNGRIADLNKGDRPREKALQYGVESLTIQELLALIIRHGIVGKSALDLAEELLYKFGDLSHLAKIKHVHELDILGISTVKGIELIAIFEIARRIEQNTFRLEDKIHSSSDVVRRYRFTLSSLNQEVFIMILLNRQNRILRECRLYQGTRSGVTIDYQELLSLLLMHHAQKYIIIHNHPSGDVLPSEDDILTTKTVAKESKRFGIKLVDHIIIGNQTYYSFLEKNLID